MGKNQAEFIAAVFLQKLFAEISQTGTRVDNGDKPCLVAYLKTGGVSAVFERILPMSVTCLCSPIQLYSCAFL